jgi:hypothetical protein
MASDRMTRLAERRAQLVTQAHLDRARLALAVHQVRHIISPPPDPARRASLRPAASTILNVLLPLLGFTRVGRVLRVVSAALTALRVARHWRDVR